MVYVTHIPGPPLAAFVERFWYYSGLCVAHGRERVLPEGTFELILNLESSPRYLYEDETGLQGTAYRRGWLSGAQTRYLVIDATPGTSLMGVHFRPGGAAPFLGFPASELADQVVEMDACWGAAADALRERLLGATSPAAKFRVLEGFLRKRLDPDALARREVRYLVSKLVQSAGCGSISSLARELGWSHKHLIDRFRKEVGVGPKRLCRILRFQQVLRTIESGKGVLWADLAAACGYFDQAHFIREFQAFSGLNPKRYLHERGDYLNYVPVR